MIYEKHSLAILSELDPRVPSLVPRADSKAPRHLPQYGRSHASDRWMYLPHLRTVNKRLRELDPPGGNLDDEGKARLKTYLEEQEALKEAMHQVRGGATIVAHIGSD